MQEIILSALGLLFMGISSIVLLSRSEPKLPMLVRLSLAFMACVVIAVSWYVAHQITKIAFGVSIIGWHPYLNGSVHVVESQRHQVFLSDGRVIGEPMKGRFDILFGSLFFLLFVAIGFSMLRFTQRRWPQTKTIRFR
jgi:hypothetical protein